MKLQFTDKYADKEIDVGGMKGCLNDLRSIKARHPHIKTILSLGGGGEGSSQFSTMSSKGSVRSTFAQNARRLVDSYALDGADSKKSPK